MGLINNVHIINFTQTQDIVYNKESHWLIIFKYVRFSLNKK